MLEGKPSIKTERAESNATYFESDVWNSLAAISLLVDEEGLIGSIRANQALTYEEYFRTYKPTEAEDVIARTDKGRMSAFNIVIGKINQAIGSGVEWTDEARRSTIRGLLEEAHTIVYGK